MKKSYSKIRHTEEANLVLEKRFLSESYKNMSRVILEQDDENEGTMGLKLRTLAPEKIKSIKEKLKLDTNKELDLNNVDIKKAIKTFQKENHLEQNGVLNPDTFYKLVDTQTTNGNTQTTSYEDEDETWDRAGFR